MVEIKGDIIELTKSGEIDIIVHGCNCFCKMGSGVAKLVRKNFPVAYYADQDTVRGDVNKLGTITTSATLYKGRLIYVFNAYTQYKYGYFGKRYVDYEALRSCFRMVANVVKSQPKVMKIGYPKIGAGRGGGDWDVIKDIIDEELGGLFHFVVNHS